MIFLIKIFADLEKLFPKVIPYVWGALSTSVLTISNLFAKKLSQDLGAAEILLFRSMQLAVFSYFLMITQNMQFHYKSPTINKLLIARALVGTAGVGLSYYGISLIPLSDAQVLLQIYPVFTGILATLCLGEKYEKSQLLAALVCFVGVIFIMQPPFIFGANTQGNPEDNAKRFLGTAILLISGLTSSGVEILLKKVGSKTNAGITTLVFGGIATVIGTIISIFQGFVRLKVIHVVWFFGLGSLSFLSQVLKNRAFVIGVPGRVSNTGYFGIVIAYLLDVFIMGNEVKPLSLVGGMCILSCMFIYMFRLYMNDKNEEKNKKAIQVK